MIVDFADHGMMPEAGGLIDQSYQAITMISTVRRERNAAKAEAQNNNGIRGR